MLAELWAKNCCRERLHQCMLSRVWFWMHWILPKHTKSSQLRIFKVDSFRSHHKKSIDLFSIYPHHPRVFFFNASDSSFLKNSRKKYSDGTPLLSLKRSSPYFLDQKKSQAPLGDLQEPCNLLIWGFSFAPYMLLPKKNTRQRGFHLFKAEKTWLENWKNQKNAFRNSDPMIQCESGRDGWRNHFLWDQ